MRVHRGAKSTWIDLLQYSLLSSRNMMSLRSILISLMLIFSTTGCDSNDSATPAVHPGKDIYFRYCGTCHGPGVADAPKFGVLEEWGGHNTKGSGGAIAYNDRRHSSWHADQRVVHELHGPATH